MIEFSDGLLTKYTTRSFSFRSGIVEQKEHVSERENDLPRENVTRRPPEFAGSRHKGPITRALHLHAASDFRERSCFLSVLDYPRADSAGLLVVYFPGTKIIFFFCLLNIVSYFKLVPIWTTYIKGYLVKNSKRHICIN